MGGGLLLLAIMNIDSSSYPQRLVVVKLGAVEQPARPREDGGDGVGGRLVTLLILAPVPCYSPVRCLGLRAANVKARQDAQKKKEDIDITVGRLQPSAHQNTNDYNSDTQISTTMWRTKGGLNQSNAP